MDFFLYILFFFLITYTNIKIAITCLYSYYFKLSLKILDIVYVVNLIESLVRLAFPHIPLLIFCQIRQGSAITIDQLIQTVPRKQEHLAPQIYPILSLSAFHRYIERTREKSKDSSVSFVYV